MSKSWNSVSLYQTKLDRFCTRGNSIGLCCKRYSVRKSSKRYSIELRCRRYSINLKCLIYSVWFRTWRYSTCLGLRYSASFVKQYSIINQLYRYSARSGFKEKLGKFLLKWYSITQNEPRYSISSKARRYSINIFDTR